MGIGERGLGIGEKGDILTRGYGDVIKNLSVSSAHRVTASLPDP